LMAINILSHEAKYGQEPGVTVFSVIVIVPR
jgi:hypothetical protein